MGLPSTFAIYSRGPCCASVCTSLTDEEATEAINIHLPTGIDTPWKIHEGTFADGTPNPCPCTTSPEKHRHILFSC